MKNDEEPMYYYRICRLCQKKDEFQLPISSDHNEDTYLCHKCRHEGYRLFKEPCLSITELTSMMKSCDDLGDLWDQLDYKWNVHYV